MAADCDRLRLQVVSLFSKRGSMHGSTLIGPGAKILAKSFAGESPSFVNTFGTSCFKVPSDRKGSLKTKVNGRKCDFRVYLYIPTSVPLVALYSPATQSQPHHMLSGSLKRCSRVAAKVFYIRCGHQAFNVSSTDPLNVVTNTKAGSCWQTSPFLPCALELATLTPVSSGSGQIARGSDSWREQYAAVKRIGLQMPDHSHRLLLEMPMQLMR